MAKSSKKRGPDIVLGKGADGLATQPNQITDMHITSTLYAERAMDELIWLLQPFYNAAKQKENRDQDQGQLLLNFSSEDAYLVTSERKGSSAEHEGDFVAIIRFRDLPGITPKHYAEVRQMFRDLVHVVAEVHYDDCVVTTNLMDIIEEHGTKERIDPKTGEKKRIKTNKLKRNEIKIRIRSEVLRNKFFITNAGFTKFHFPVTRHTKTVTANRLYKWLSKWRGIKKDSMTMEIETLPDGIIRQVGRIVFRADYMEVRAECGLFNSADGTVINGVRIPQQGEKDRKDGHTITAEEQLAAEEAARKKYAYYSEFAKRYLAQAKKELEDLVKRKIADFDFDYRAIFADGRAKGKVPEQVEFTINVYDKGRELYNSLEVSAKEINARSLMKQLSIQATEAGKFISRLRHGDHDHFLQKLEFLIEESKRVKKNDLQGWAMSCINTFFKEELPGLRGYAAAQEVSTNTGESTKKETPSTDWLGRRIVFTKEEQDGFDSMKRDLQAFGSKTPQFVETCVNPLQLVYINDKTRVVCLGTSDGSHLTPERFQYYNAYAKLYEVFHRHFPEWKLAMD